MLRACYQCCKKDADVVIAAKTPPSQNNTVILLEWKTVLKQLFIPGVLYKYVLFKYSHADIEY